MLSSSKLRLQLLVDTGTKSTDALRKLRKELAKSDDISIEGKTGAKFREKLQEYIKAGKAPFVNKTQFEEAERIINAYSKKINQINEQIKNQATATPAQEAKLKRLEKELNAWEKLYDRSYKKRVEMEKAALDKTKQIEKERQNFLKGIETKNQADLKRLLKNQNDAKISAGKKEFELDNKLLNMRLKNEERQRKLAANERKKYLSDWDAAIKQNEIFDKKAKDTARKAQDRIIANEKSRQDLINKSLQLSEKYLHSQKALAQIQAVRDKITAIDPKDPQSTAKLKEAKQAMANLTGELIMQEGKLNPLIHAWNKFRIVFGRVFSALMSFLLLDLMSKVFIGFFTSLVKSNQLLEVLEARLRALIPTTNEVKAVWESLAELTVTTPFKLQDFVEAATLVKAFGVDIRSNMEAIANWSSAIGRDLADTAVSFGKIASYSPRTALLLSTRGFSLALYESYVEKYKNRTIALNKLIQDTFGGTARRISRTFEGLLTNINDLWVLISQKIGEPIFVALKNDVRLLYNLMVSLNKDGGKGLTFIGRAIKEIAYLLAGGGIAMGFAFLIMQIKKLLTFIKSGTTLAAIFSKSFMWTTIIVGITNVIFTYKKLAQAQQDVIDGERELRKASEDDMISKLDANKKIIEGLQTQRDELNSVSGVIIGILTLWDNWFSRDYTYQAIKDRLDKAIRHHLAEQKSLQMKDAAKKRSLMIQNAELTALEKYTAQQSIANAGLMDYFKTLTKVQQKRLEIATFRRITAEKLGIDTEKFLDIEAGEKAKLSYLKQFTEGTITYAEAVTKSKQALAEQLKQIVTNIQESTNLKTSFEENKEELIKIISQINQTNKAFDTLISKMEEYRTEFAGTLEEFRTLTKGEYSVQIAKLIKSKTMLFEKGIISDKTGFILSDDDIERMDAYLAKIQINKKSKEEEIRLGKLSEIQINKILEDLEKQNDIRNNIINLIRLSTKLTENETNEIVKQNEEFKELVITARRYYSQLSQFGVDISGKIVKMRGGQLDRNFLQKQIENYQNQQRIIENEIENLIRPLTLEDAKKEYELRNEILDLRKDELSILETIVELNDTFGKAFANYVISMSNNMANWRYEIVEGLADAIKGFASSGIKEIFSGEKTKELNKQIDDLKFKLNKIQAEKRGIQIIEDEEANTLAEINRLEKERANIIGTFLNDALKKVQDKLIDMAVNSGLNELFKLLGDFSGINDLITQEREIAKIKTEAGERLIALSAADLALAYQRLAIELQIAAAKGGKAGSKGDAIMDLGMDIFRLFSSLPSGGNIPIGRLPKQGTNYDISRLTRNIANNSYQNHYTTIVQFSGPVYGMNDFNKQVDKALSENRRNRS